MALNPNIALQVKGFEPPNPLAQMAQVTQIQNALQQQQMTGMQLQQLEQDRREMQELQQKLSQMGANPDLRAVAQTLMRSPKTLQVGAQMMEKLKEQDAFAAYLKSRGAPAAAPAAAAAPTGTVASPVPMTRERVVPELPVSTDAIDAARPMPATQNALAPAPAPTNALVDRGLRSPADIRREMEDLAQFPNIPAARARMDILKTELAEAVKAPTLHNVTGVGAVDPRTGRIVVPEVQRPTATQQDYDRAVQQGFEGTFLDYKKAVAEAGRPVTNVTTNLPPGEKAEEVKRGELFVEDQKKVASNATTARKSLAGIQSAQDVLSRDFETGFLTETKAKAASVLAALGISGAEKFATDAQKFLQATTQRVLDAQLEQKGVQTNQDAQRIEQTGARMGNTKAANEFILDVARAQAERAIAHDKFYRDWLRDPKNKNSLRGAEDAWLESEGNKSIFESPRLKKYGVLESERTQATLVPQGPVVGGRSATPRGAAPSAPFSDAFSVTAPDGKTYTFPTQDAANQFRTRIGGR